MLRIALGSFISLLFLTEVVLWLRNLTLPLPVMLAVGAILAVASNWRYLRASE